MKTLPAPFPNYLIFLAIGMLLPIFLPAQIQNAEEGQPLIRHFFPEEFQSDPNCISILQDQHGMIYVANERGVLEFDGENWKLIPVPTGHSVQALAQGGDGTLYTGGVKNIGYLDSDSCGGLQFRSLLGQLPEEQRDFGFFRDAVAAQGDTVYLRGERYLVELAGRRLLRSWPVNGWRGTFYLDGRLYVSQLDQGLMVLKGNQLVPVPGGNRFSGTHVYFMESLGKELLVGTMEGKLFRFDPSLQNDKAFRAFPTEADDYLRQHQCYNGLVLPNGNVAIGTFTGGLVILNQKGQCIRIIHQLDDLSVRVVEGMVIDRQGGLWFTSENGITRLETRLPISKWSQERGLSSRLTSICRYGGKLFLASYNELLLFDPVARPDAPFSNFGRLGRLINPICLLNIRGPDGKNRMMVGGTSGLAEISLDGSGKWREQVIDTEQNSEFLYHFSAYPGHLYILNRINNEVRALKLEGAQWVEDGRLSVREPTALAINEDGSLWVGTYYHGFARLYPASNGRLDGSRTVYYGTEKGLPSSNFTAPYPILGTLYFETEAGACRFDAVQDRFIPAPALSAWMAQLDVDYLIPDNGGNLQLLKFKAHRYQVKGLAIRRGEPAGFPDSFQIDTVSRKRLPAILSCEYTEPDGIIWLGTNRGLYRYDPGQAAPWPGESPEVHIRTIRVGEDSLIFAGSPVVGGSIQAAESNTLSLEQPLAFAYNTIYFSFAAQGYDDIDKNEYRYRLLGFAGRWTDWSDQPIKEYTNLPEGSYEFQVQGRDVYGNISAPAGFRFSINPPWWRTPAAYFGMALLGILGFGTILWQRSSRHRRQMRRKQAQLERQQQLNERLRQVDKLKDQFLANTSHELRTPLNGIIGLAEGLLEQEKDTENIEDLTMIISSGKRLSSMVNDILDFSKLKNKEIEFHPKPVDVHALADIVLRIHAPMAKGKDLRLSNRVPKTGSVVLGDENRLAQILHNLVGNALKFTESGYIRIQAEPKDGKLQIAVQDTGTGIPDNKKEAIFQEFEQADGSIQREFTGTGLGLSISKKLVEVHGGSMWVESTLGKGSTFFFTIPLSKEKTAPHESGTDSVVRPYPNVRGQEAPRYHKLTLSPIAKEVVNGEQIRILLVDDEPINQRVLQNHLRKEHFLITPAMNGQEALQLVESEAPFDLVLLDVMMPRMSGYEVCQKIREQYLPSELPVIMVTAKNQVNDLVQGLAVGANDYLAKPFSREEFLARVKTHLYLHRINMATGKFVPTEFLHALGREAITEVRLGDQVLREVTVFFSDIRGYTTLSESMSPSDNFRFVNTLNGRLGPYIRDNHGFINQYLGDAIMAIFPEKAGDALRAGIAMQQALQEYNVYRRQKGRKPVRLGMGIHTGPLIMGIIGDHKRMDAATIADTVNTASRIENLTKYYRAGMLLSEDSYLQIAPGEELFFRYLGKVQVMGKQKPLGIYECFSGDEPQDRQLKMETREQFEAAVEAYFKQDFTQALQGLLQVLAHHPQDQAAHLFMEEARRLAAEGAPPGWTGVVEMRAK
ncbi:MAG: response regulator [Phaeodactylibacter sp.]|nr:response regulator [Phaeodactylibacter sp.]MCB9300540.1 response regulator [Lewinellaceae bacterium]